MQKTMQALVKKKREPGLWLDEVPVPGVGINDVLIKIHKASICSGSARAPICSPTPLLPASWRPRCEGWNY